MRHAKRSSIAWMVQLRTLLSLDTFYKTPVGYPLFTQHVVVTLNSAIFLNEPIISVGHTRGRALVAEGRSRRRCVEKADSIEGNAFEVSLCFLLGTIPELVSSHVPGGNGRRVRVGRGAAIGIGKVQGGGIHLGLWLLGFGGAVLLAASAGGLIVDNHQSLGQAASLQEGKVGLDVVRQDLVLEVGAREPDAGAVEEDPLVEELHSSDVIEVLEKDHEAPKTAGLDLAAGHAGQHVQHPAELTGGDLVLDVSKEQAEEAVRCWDVVAS